jgi:hypothetical protein
VSPVPFLPEETLPGGARNGTGPHA